MTTSGWAYFKSEEIQGLETEVVAKLDMARHRAGVPFNIVQPPRRTPEHNAAVGGVPDSAHLRGLAVDLTVANSQDLFHMIDGALFAGFRRVVIGIEINPTDGTVIYHNLHLDADDSLPTPVIAVKRYGG